MGLKRKHSVNPEAILDRFYSVANFIPMTRRGKEVKMVTTEVSDKYKGRISIPTLEPMKGVMYGRCELSHLEQVSGLDKDDVYSELERLARAGHIGITGVYVKPSSARFCAILGEATHLGHMQDVPHVHRSYKSDPLTEGERKNYILNVKETIKQKGLDIEKEMVRRYPAAGQEIERKMRKEDREENIERNALLSAIANKLSMDARG